ncbi:MAG TPA: hypothetical protein VGJ78_26340 [Vicinamibacterales bacterium]|jgi:hypothetical protein
MADKVRVVDYFYVTLPNKPGEGARALDTLRTESVNLLAFSAFPAGRKAQADFVPEDPAAFRRAAKKAKWKVTGPKKVFLVEGDDRVGAVADVIGALAAAKVNITALDAVRVHGRYGAIFWVKAKDLKKATKAMSTVNAATDAMAAALSTLGP